MADTASNPTFKFELVNLPDYSKQPQDFPFLFDVYSLAYAIGVAPKTLYYLLKSEKIVKLVKGKKVESSQTTFVKNKHYRDLRVTIDETEQVKKDGMYREMRIPKKRPGEYRILHDPSPILKHVQRQLLDNFLSKLPLPEYVTGFVKDIGIVDTAKEHVGKEIVCCVDIHNFFPSIKEWMVRDCILSYGWPERIARTISELVTYHNFVPQGAPTSPTISNLVGYHRFDKPIKALADRYEFTYSRYADDLVFSSNRTDTKHNGEIDYFLSQVAEILTQAKFEVSEDKTKIMRKGATQTVLGQCVANERPTLPGRKYRLLRAIVHNCQNQGIGSQAKKSKQTPEAFIRSIKGHLSFLNTVDPIKFKRLNAQFQAALFTFNPKETHQVEVAKNWENEDYDKLPEKQGAV